MSLYVDGRRVARLAEGQSYDLQDSGVPRELRARYGWVVSGPRSVVDFGADVDMRVVIRFATSWRVLVDCVVAPRKVLLIDVVMCFS